MIKTVFMSLYSDCSLFIKALKIKYSSRLITSCSFLFSRVFIYLVYSMCLIRLFRLTYLYLPHSFWLRGYYLLCYEIANQLPHQAWPKFSKNSSHSFLPSILLPTHKPASSHLFCFQLKSRLPFSFVDL